MEPLEKGDEGSSLDFATHCLQVMCPLGLSFPIHEMGRMLLTPWGSCEDELHMKSLAHGWHTLGTQGNGDCEDLALGIMRF